MKSDVSVIIPFYSGVSWLIEAVDSVLNQTYKAKEIIVVNDGSKENIDDFLEKYYKNIIYIYKENGGPATARNLGIEKSSGKYIAFLDSDDIWLPTKLEKQVKFMEKTNCVWSHTSYETFDTEIERDNTLKEISVADLNGNIYPYMIMSNRLATPCIMIKGDLLKNNKNLRFNNNMRYGQDQYLWINIALNYEIFSIDQVLTKVRIRGSNAAFRAKVQLKARSDLWDILKSEEKKYRLKEISKPTRLAFKFTNIGKKIINYIEEYSNNEVFLEFVSRVLYILPWVIFKFDYKRHIKITKLLDTIRE